ncbi:MAG: flagellin [Pseudomonadota bacterium]
MSSILTNTSAMVALQTLNTINRDLASTQSMISTGKKVESAKDNAAIWAISKVMESDVKGFKAISESLGLGESTVAVARQATETVTDLLTDIKGKIIAAQEENVDRTKIQTDIDTLRDQISTVVNSAQFNGLNAVLGTDDINVLSSLDRSADGSVTASNITIARQDLSTSAGVYGTGGTDLSANITASAGTVESDADTKKLDLAVASTAGDTFEITIGGSTVSAASTGTAATDADTLVGAINALGLTGVSANNNSGTIEIFNTNSFDDVAVTYAVTGGNGSTLATATTGSATIEQRAEEVELSTSAQVNEGDGYQITVGGNNYRYIAGKGETMEDVAKGLKTAIDGGGETGVTTKAVQDSGTGAWQVLVDYDGTGSSGTDITLTDAGVAGGTASGGLFGLDNVDVTSNAGANSALDNIETLINNSIDAAAEFGSAQGRIQIQNDFVSKLADAFTAGIGTLVDTNMEEASAKLQALQVQQQLGIQSLSIANQQPQNILSLFR